MTKQKAQVSGRELVLYDGTSSYVREVIESPLSELVTKHHW